MYGMKDMKDHEISMMVNKLADIARAYHDHQSLRERISAVVVSAVKPPESSAKNAGTEFTGW